MVVVNIAISGRVDVPKLNLGGRYGASFRPDDLKLLPAYVCRYTGACSSSRFSISLSPMFVIA
jgi:hypothetical protein